MQNKDHSSKSILNDRNSIETAKDYISGDSTPSSSGHQFSKLATGPKHDSKKSAQKTNS